MDFYVIRESVSGTEYYDGYANGVFLQGTGALGNSIKARVKASDVCWDQNNTGRIMVWFAEAQNYGDSMGGWNSSGAKDHLDYNPLSFSHDTGWVSPSNLTPGGCNAGSISTIFLCTVVSNTHTYIDTSR